MPVVELTNEQLLQAVKQLPANELHEFKQSLSRLLQERAPLSPVPQETGPLAGSNEGIPQEPD